MKLIANSMNGEFLRDILPNNNEDIDGVYAAIAYGSDINSEEKYELIGNCLTNNLRLDIWMRYDHTVPVSISLLKRLLKNHKNNIYCKLIPDCLHAKVIWWKGYGAYIGSANLSDRAWISNIEAGIFLTEDDLHTSGMISEVEIFFESIKDIDKSITLSDEIILEMEELQKLQNEVKGVGKNKRKHPEWNGPNFTSKKNANERRKENFRKEWDETLTTLRKIGDELAVNKPQWIKGDIPIGWQIDQFLHAYYYNKVSDGLKKPFEEFHKKNRKDPQRALNENVIWWKNTLSAPSNEDDKFYSSAPIIKDKLDKKNLLNLTQDEFSQVCFNTFAIEHHVVKINLSTLGKPNIKSMSRDERIPLFSEWLLGQQNKKGWDIKGLLHYVLYEGKDEDLWERLYNSAFLDDYKFPHFGLSTLSELVGWSRPEVAPPRNGRTNKALRALGYDVKIY